MRTRAVICALLLVIPVASFAGKKPPDWINGVSARYPQKAYLVGVGLGDTLDAARSAARAEIAKVFRAKITQSALDTHTERTVAAAGDVRTASRQESSLATTVTTDELLEGVEVVETWQNPKKKSMQYALAVLDRSAARRALMQRMADQEETASARLAQARKAPAGIEQVRAFSAALAAIDRRDALAVRLQVLDPAGGAGAALGMTRADIEAQRAAAAARIRFVIKTDGTPGLADRLAAKVTALGFAVVPGGTAALTIDAKTVLTPVDRGNPQWKFCSWQGTAAIVDPALGGKTVATVLRDGQAAQMSMETVQTKAAAEAAEALADAVERELAQYVAEK